MKILSAICVVLVLLVLVFWWLLRHRYLFITNPLAGDDSSGPTEDELITMKSRLPALLEEYGVQSLKGLRGIFEFEFRMGLTVYDDTAAQKLQIYDAGQGKEPRWTVLLPFVKDHVGKGFHPVVQFDETLDIHGWKSDHVYPYPDYRKLYGRKVPFSSLAWEVQVFILQAIQAPIMNDYTLPTQS